MSNQKNEETRGSESEFPEDLRSQTKKVDEPIALSDGKPDGPLPAEITQPSKPRGFGRRRANG